MKLSLVRQEYATLVRGVVGDNVTVVDSLPDSLAPPAVLVAWADPWLAPATYCAFTANVELMIVAQRIEPGGQYEVIENIVSEVVEALRSQNASIRDITSPYPLQWGGVDYLSASINIMHEVE